MATTFAVRYVGGRPERTAERGRPDPPDGGFVWIDVADPSPTDLSTRFGLHPLGVFGGGWRRIVTARNRT